MKAHWPTVVVVLAAATATSTFGQSYVFLHHSVGANIYFGGNVEDHIRDHNSQHGTSIVPSERHYMDENYPYDYWNTWVNGQCGGSSDRECIGSLASEYDLIIFKHCYPVCWISESSGEPDVTSSEKTVENYKLQYRALRTMMDSRPDTKFMAWTAAPLTQSVLSESGGPAMIARARAFAEWVRDDWLTEDGQEHPNIFVFDFFGLATDPATDCMRPEYANGDDPHPNDAAAAAIGPLFAQAITDALGGSAVAVSARVAQTGAQQVHMKIGPDAGYAAARFLLNGMAARYMSVAAGLHVQRSTLATQGVILVR
jgi:hypothetical protein